MLLFYKPFKSFLCVDLKFPTMIFYIEVTVKALGPYRGSKKCPSWKNFLDYYFCTIKSREINHLCSLYLSKIFPAKIEIQKIKANSWQAVIGGQQMESYKVLISFISSLSLSFYDICLVRDHVEDPHSEFLRLLKWTVK